MISSSRNEYQHVARDRWQALIDVYRLIYQRELKETRGKIESLMRNSSPQSVTTWVHETAMRSLNVELDYHLDDMRRIDWYQEDIDNGGDRLYDDSQWHDLHQQMIKDLQRHLR